MTVPPTRQDLTQIFFIVGILGEVAHEPRLVHCWSNALHKITKCNVNNASHGKVSRHVFQVTLWVMNSPDLLVQCYVNLCLSLFAIRHECQAAF